MQSAHEAFDSWSKISKAERADYLLEISRRIEENKEHLATVESLQNGKPYRETSTIDVPQVAEQFKYFAGVLTTDEGSVNQIDHNTMSLVVNEPVGSRCSSSMELPNPTCILEIRSSISSG